LGFLGGIKRYIAPLSLKDVPINEVLENPERTIDSLRKISTGDGLTEKENLTKTYGSDPIKWLVICRRGNDSLVAADTLNHFLTTTITSASDPERDHNRHPIHREHFLDFVGGLETYSLELNSAFPLY
jgi:hypothetical protein